MAGIFGKKPQSQQSPALSGLNIQTSAAGKVIPVLYGQMRFAPNLLWYANFQAHEHIQEQGKGGSSGCFVAGTRIATPTGELPIEQLTAGDAILCVDAATGEVATGVVTSPHRHATAETGDTMMRVHAGDFTLYVTRGHYLYVYGPPTANGHPIPIRAEQIVPGQHAFVRVDGELEVDAIEDAPLVEFVYNLSVAPHDNYFAEGLLVHNGGGSSKSKTYTYTADLLWGLCEGFAQLPNDRVYIDKAVTTAGALGMTLSKGPDAVAAPWSYLVTNYPSQAVPYPGVAWAGSSPYDLGDNVQLPNFNFELSRDGFTGLRDAWAGGTYSIYFFGGDPPWLSGFNGADQGPTDLIYDILTNGRYGCGFGPQVGNTGGANFAHDMTVPTSPYQVFISGGGGTSGNTIGVAMGPAWLIEVLDTGSGVPLTQLAYRAGVDPGTGNFMVTDNLDQYLTQPSTNYTERPLGGTLLQLSPNLPYLMTITFGAADAGRAVTVVYQETGGYRSASTNCFVSTIYSDQRTASEVLEELADVASSGFVWSSGMLQMRPRYGGGGGFNLDDDDFLPNQGGVGSGGDDPVQFTRKRAADQSNIVKVEYKDRDLAYAPGVAIASDQAHIDAYGRRELGSKSMPFANATAATFYANYLLNRQQVRTTYYFTLGPQWVILDPLDIVSISDSALGLQFADVIILEMTENDDGSINFIAEEVLGATTATAPTYTVNQSTGFQPDTNADPGPVNTPIILEAPTKLTGGEPEIWAAISGASALWAGARVWLSTDGGSSYTFIGTQFGAARMGVLASLPTGADPDVTHTPSVDLTESRGTLTSVTMAQADLGLTLSIVDNELFAYETATLTAANVYTLGYLRRALDGTVQASHTAAPFARLDALIFKHAYTTAMIGQTIYLKFTSFNTYGSGEESLASVTAYPYTITGGGFGGGTGGVPATPTGLAATSTGP